MAVVCNYNKREYVAGCVQSVVESAFEGLDVVVVDNASDRKSTRLNSSHQF